ENTKPKNLTAEQKIVLDKLVSQLSSGSKQTSLLHGVTGSGKTEVYLQAIQHVLTSNRQAIVLVPEIALTPQMVSNFKGRFGDAVAVMHSGLGVSEKYDEWRKIERQEVDVVVGARSAIFAPFRNLGLIIIDEEHESTYKQGEHPRYDAREVAQLRANYSKATVLLGSATPSFESYARAKRGVYTLLEMKTRANAKSLPEVTIVDMRDELKKGNHSMFSDKLRENIEATLEKKEQMVIFLNRRGFSSFVMCRGCGLSMKCEQCDVNMTYHHGQQQLKCHYCGDEATVPKICPSCKSEHIRYFGVGTERVEMELQKAFPSIRIIRMDQDTTSRKGAHEKLLSSFQKGEADCLLGTQMIAKGLDFPKVTLVGVLTADSMLGLPDFRAGERTFSLLTQVSGRAGRHELPGETIIQTYNPDHPAITCAATSDFEAFYAHEMVARRDYRYPPFVYLVYIVVAHEDMRIALKASSQMAAFLKQKVSPETQVIGASVCPITRIQKNYRYGIMIKYRFDDTIVPILHQLYKTFSETYAKEKLSITIDHHPLVMM
ncbi:MAG: primosomal protein N', partial [Bacilli bacterium]